MGVERGEREGVLVLQLLLGECELTALYACITYLFATYISLSLPNLSCIQAQKSAYVSYRVKNIENCSSKTFSQPLKFPLEA